MNDPLFPRRFAEAMRPGSYLRIVAEGTVGAGDEILILSRPDHGLTVRDVSRIYSRDRDEVGRLIENPHLSDSWKAWATDFLQATRRHEPDPDSTRQSCSDSKDASS